METINIIIAFVLGAVWGYFSAVVLNFFREVENETVYR